MTRILVVEDSPTQALPIRFVLQKADYQADLAANGVLALTALEQADYDLVLTDLQMPEMDGLQLVEAVRQRYPGLPVVLATAGGSDEMFLQALRAGAVHYASKQGLDFELVDTVRRVLLVTRKEKTSVAHDPCLDQIELRWSLDHDRARVPAVVTRIIDALTPVQLFDKTTLLQVSVALMEAIVNAIVHGNLALDERPQHQATEFEQHVEQRRQQAPFCDRKVALSARADRQEAKFIIADEGAGFQFARWLDAAASGIPDPGTGRGLFLIRTFMDDVSHNASGTQLTMIKRRTK